MALFSHEEILKIPTGKEKHCHSFLPDAASVKDLCEFYDLNSYQVVEELENLANVYKVTYSKIDISDLLFDEKNKNQLPGKVCDDSSCTDEAEALNQDGEEENSDTDKLPLSVDRWVKRGFVRPYRCLRYMSSFPQLAMLYRTLLLLPVTSCTAERTMSRIKIVKNRLRSSLGDDWLSSLLVLSSESDILKQIPNEEIIERFATSSAQRKKVTSI